MKAMEDHKDDLILILAGYHKEMDNFLQTNPGLRSRFPIHIEFQDYSHNELIEIADQMCTNRQYQLSPQARLALLCRLNEPIIRANSNFGNARTVRNLIEKAFRLQAVRLVKKNTLSKQDLMLLEPSDLPEVET
ncbi:MAG: spoVK [Firmicutes bacterium]|nr:spoVK [Bacillota bacterium]